MPERPRKLRWVGSSKKDLAAMPADVQDVFGRAILDLEFGDTPDGARPFGEGVPSEVWKLVENHDGETYRAAYTVHFDDVVYVLDVFQKKSKSGAKTPKPDKERVIARFKAAKNNYEQSHTENEKTR